MSKRSQPEEEYLLDDAGESSSPEPTSGLAGGKMLAVVFALCFLPIAGFLAGSQYALNVGLAERVEEKVQPYIQDIEMLERDNNHLQTQLHELETEIANNEEVVRTLRLVANSIHDTEMLVPYAYRVANQIISTRPGEESVLFSDVDTSTFAQLEQFSGDTYYRPVADGDYVPRWFEDENFLYCIEGKGVDESIQIAQPVVVEFESVTTVFEEATSDMWYVWGDVQDFNPAIDADGFGYVSFFASSTQERYDIYCNSIETP